MSTAVDTITAQACPPDAYSPEHSATRLASVAHYQFHIDAVKLGTTKRGKPPRGTTARDFVLTIVGLIGFLLLAHGLRQETSPPPHAERRAP